MLRYKRRFHMQPDVLSADLRRPRDHLKGEREPMMASSSSSSPPPLGVRVKRDLLAACMTCPICKKLFKDATTISECLHTFCRKCILEKLDDEEADCCPVCNIYLGVEPVEKIRPDHNLQDIRAKIFPLKRRKVNALEVAPSITLPVRRKERSLSSLVVSTPRVTTQPGVTGKRTKATARRASALRGLGPIIEESKKEVKDVEDFAENTSQNRRQSSSSAETSNHTHNNSSENEKGSFKEKSELWKPLNHLLEAANRTKPPKSTTQSFGTDNEVYMHKTNLREPPTKSKIQVENDCNTPIIPVKVRGRRQQRQKKRDLEISAQALIDAAGAAQGRRTGPIWLTLLPSYNQKGDAVLPPISACYLRIKDDNLSVSFVQKYLAGKLNLASGADVEIACRGETVSPTMTLHNLEDLWLRSKPAERVQATVGTSAKDFVMVLDYRRKAPAP